MIFSGARQPSVQYPVELLRLFANLSDTVPKRSLDSTSWHLFCLPCGGRSSIMGSIRLAQPGRKAGERGHQSDQE